LNLYREDIMSKGIIYINSSHENLKYVKEAEESAKSFKKYIPDAEYILYTDATSFKSEVFDEVRETNFDMPEILHNTDHKNGQMVAKHRALLESKYDKTMYLGSDTYALTNDVGSLFDLLDRFDVAASHAPWRINTTAGNTSIPEIPVCYPEFNCDVVLYNNNEKIMEMLESWKDMYLKHEFQHPHDQGAFRYLMYFSDLGIATLPEEYNYRGKSWRKDTVILQNRDLLPEYLNPSRNRVNSGTSLITRIKRKIFG